MAISTEEETATKPDVGIVEKMANEEYYQILLAENSGDFKWGAHYVGLNEYGTWLPREQSMLVAKSILDLLDSANAAIKYIDAEGDSQISRRKDVTIMERRGPFTAKEAHVKRLECTDERGVPVNGKMPVYPTKIPARAAEALSVPDEPKKGQK